MKIGVISLGCAKNLVDTENLLGMLKEADQTLTTSPSEAEAIIINTCGFIESAKQEAIDTILRCADYKEENCKKLIVMGCLSQRYKKDLVEEMPEVDRFIAIDEYGALGTILSEVLGVKIPNTYGKSTRVLSAKPWMGYLKIADGCDNKCSYCAIPLIRGPYRSMDMDELVNEAKRLADSGVKELNLIAQDTTRYGTDTFKKRMLTELLKRINAIEGLHWIRVLYMYPDEIDDELIEEMKHLDKVLPYFDIPVQHGSNRMLKLMNRRGSIESIREICARIKKGYERPVLRTTLIAGFPSETLEDHELTLDMMREIEWDRLGAFTYSKEEDTPSYPMEDDVSEEEKIRRLNEIMDLQKEIAIKKNNALVGETLEVLVEGYNGLMERYTGRSVFSAPDGVDGEVIFKSEEPLNQGDFVMVKIKRTRGHDLIGERI